MGDRTGLVPVMAVAIVNGIFSPWVLVLFVLYPVWYPSWAPATTQFVYMASALILSTLTMMVSGVPAALYKRLSSSPSDTIASTIWLAGAALLAMPAVPNVLKALGAN
jgi:hypothetical protein